MTRIAIVGGSGALGFGLGLRWALSGHEIVIGSRNMESALSAVENMIDILRSEGPIEPQVGGALNPEAARGADVVVLAVPFQQQEAAIDAIFPVLDGQIVVDTTVPLVPPKVGTVQLPASGSSANTLQARLGNRARLVSAFQNVAANKLRSLELLDCDVLVSGDDKEACGNVVDLCGAAGLRGFYAGPLANAVAAEALTSVLITINRQYKCHAGIRITGLEG
jgi:8-hydroxy-5-deazaflavin:NADPH oxidoreductase